MSEIVKGFDYTVKNGEVLALIGASGLGKTALERVVVGAVERRGGLGARRGRGRSSTRTTARTASRTGITVRATVSTPWRRSVLGSAGGALPATNEFGP
ncbi:ATP-binding cassette domain-containing protein [Paraburkholderia guartelaensis]|uniref:ATP-binding cassette domain-containing protein n=1 Tax=Paraburkholderia guartelaensis TaxID=2546446 RepID=A0A4R5L6P7_9BURK|nr:ATP-binding cassette domain-containing protein [Paraburkholderia guartelaensis]TDG03342.1 ATP-binding cassette domain-containing protein [Paraburkholderia guartelaensis]